jgi:DNA-binding NtrC family response regulator
MEAAKVVCVIDDDSAFQKMMNQHLTSMGFIVRSFFSGRELEMINEKPFAILLDHYLDGEENGLDILKKLKSKMPKVPVIYMTSDRSHELKNNARKSGVFEYIEKSPASLVHLRTALDRIATGAHEKNWFQKIFSFGNNKKGS